MNSIEKRWADAQQKAEEEKKDLPLSDVTMQTEGLIPGQTPMRITSPAMRDWNTIQGIPVDKEANANAPADRKNFIFVEPGQEKEVIRRQYQNYEDTPKKYKLPEDPTVEQIVKKFDQSNPQTKLDLLKKQGINTKERTSKFRISDLNPLDVKTAEAAPTDIESRWKEAQQKSIDERWQVAQQQSAEERKPILRAARPTDIPAVTSPTPPGTSFIKDANGNWMESPTMSSLTHTMMRVSPLEMARKGIELATTPGLTPEEYEKQASHRPVLESLTAPLAGAVVAGAVSNPGVALPALARFMTTQEVAQRTVLPFIKEIQQHLNKKEVKYEKTSLSDILPPEMRNTADIAELVAYGGLSSKLKLANLSPENEQVVGALRLNILRGLGIKPQTAMAPLTPEQIAKLSPVKQARQMTPEQIAAMKEAGRQEIFKATKEEYPNFQTTAETMVDKSIEPKPSDTIPEDMQLGTAPKAIPDTLVVPPIKGGVETPLPEKPKLPYVGVEPGTPQWKQVWDANPQLQGEMLDHQKNLERNVKLTVMKKAIEAIPEDSPFVEDFLARHKTSRAGLTEILGKIENNLPLAPAEGNIYNMFKNANIDALKQEIETYDKAIRENAAKEDLIRSGLPESEIQKIIDAAREKGRSRARTPNLGRKRKVRASGEMTLERAINEKLITPEEVNKIATSFAKGMYRNWQQKIKEQRWNNVLSDVEDLVQDMWTMGLTRAWDPSKPVEQGVKSVMSSVLRSKLTALSAPDVQKITGENLIKYNKAISAIEKEGKIPTREEIAKRTGLSERSIFLAELDNMALQSFEPGVEGNLEGNKTGRKNTKAPTDTIGFAKLKKSLPAMDNNPVHIEMPEMVQLYEMLTKQPMALRKFTKYWGVFKSGEGRVYLNPKIFANTKFALSVMAHEIGHLIDWLPDLTMNRGNILGRLNVLRNFLKYEFMRNDGTIIKNKEVTDELKGLTKWWNPFDDTKSETYTAYRFSSKELYAEFMSVLINNPEKAQEMAPISWRMFWDELYKKPAVETAFLELNSFLKMGPGEKFRVREQRLKLSYMKGEELLIKGHKETVAARKNLWFHIKAELLDKNIPTLEYIKKLEKAGIKINPDDNPRYYLEDANMLGGKLWNDIEDIYKGVLKPIIDTGMSYQDAHDNVGSYMYMEWVIQGRLDEDGNPLPNPYGYTAQTAQDFLNGMRTQYGNDHFNMLVQAQKNLRAKIEAMLLEAAEVGYYNMDQLYGKMDKKTGLRAGGIMTQTAYAPVRILEYADKYISTRIIQMKGASPSTAPANTLTVMTMKLMNLRRVIEKQKVKISIRDMYRLFPKEWVGEQLEKIPARSTSKYGPDFDRHKKAGKGMLIMYEDGKKVGYYIDPDIAESLDTQSAAFTHGIAALMNFLNSSFLRPVFTGWNVGFQAMHSIRLIWTAWVSTNSSLGDIMLWMKRTHPLAYQFAFKDMTPKLYYDMRQQGLLGFRFNDIFGLAPMDEEGQMDYLMRRYRQIGQKRNFNLFEFLGDLGNYLESLNRGTLTQIFKHTDAGKGFSEKEIEHLIRFYGGTPAMIARGRIHPWSNNFSMFFNDMVQGTRGQIEAGFIEPRTRAGFWWKRCAAQMLPKFLMFLGAMGYFGPKIKQAFDRQSEYKKSRYLIIPIGETADKKAINAKLPYDPFGRIVTGLFWKALNTNKDNFKGQLEGMADIGGEMLPQGNPYLNILDAWKQFLRGHTPYDAKSEEPILNDNEMRAASDMPGAMKYALPKMAAWTLGQVGFSAITDKKPAHSTAEWVAENIPIYARFIDVTDAGTKEAERKKREHHYQHKAMKSLDRSKERRDRRNAE